MKQILEIKNNVWLFTIVLIFCFAFSAGIRFKQFETWGKSPSVFFVGEKPLMTTLDAPLWLRSAREYNQGMYGEKNYLRGYPESTKNFKINFNNELSIPEEYIDHALSENRIHAGSIPHLRI